MTYEPKPARNVSFSKLSLLPFKDTESGSVDFQQVTTRTGTGSSFLAYFNVVCVIAGTGTLGLPAALKLGGWIGLVILFLAWTMSIVSLFSPCLCIPKKFFYRII